MNKGDKINHLTLIKEERVNDRSGWLCQCDCGNYTKARETDLKHNKIVTCSKRGCPYKKGKGKFKDLTGKQFGRLTVIEREKNNNNCNKVVWKCRCACGERDERCSSNAD